MPVVAIPDAENARKMAREFDLSDPRRCWHVHALIWEWVDKAPQLLNKELGAPSELPTYTNVMKTRIIPEFFSHDESYINRHDTSMQRMHASVVDAKSREYLIGTPTATKIHDKASLIMRDILRHLITYIVNQNPSSMGRQMLENILAMTNTDPPMVILTMLMSNMPPPELWMGAGLLAYESCPGGYFRNSFILTRYAFEESIARWIYLIPKVTKLEMSVFYERRIALTPFYGAIDSLQSTNASTEYLLREINRELLDICRPRKLLPSARQPPRAQDYEPWDSAEVIKMRYFNLSHAYNLKFEISDSKIYKGKRARALVAGLDSTATAQPTKRSKKNSGEAQKTVTRKETQTPAKADRKTSTCHHCGELGHFKAQCPKRQAENKAAKLNVEDEEA